MKFASFTAAGRQTWGKVDGESIVDMGAAFPSLKAFIEAGQPDLSRLLVDAPRLPLAQISLDPVIANPGKIICVGLNYESHRLETGRNKMDHPTIFVRFADSQIGHEQPVIRPRVSTHLDFEGELAVIIGEGGRSITAGDALSHIAGYSCYNDVSVRDWQRHTHQFTPGKNFPGTGAFGPFMVTADELPDPQATSVTTRLNGEVVQSQSTAEMLFPVARLIEYISTWTPLAPGDVIVTGTPGGVGAMRTPPLWMKPGDIVEVEIPGVGLLRNPIRAED